MSNFIYDDTGLNGPKSDLAVIPVGANANQWVAADDWNQIRQALLDIQTVMQGNQLVIASPVGADNWIKLLSGVTDTPTAVGVIIDTVAGTFSTSGMPLLSVRKGGVEQFKVDRGGIITCVAAQTSGLGNMSAGSFQVRQAPGNAALLISPSAGVFTFSTNSGLPNSGLIRFLSGQANGANTYYAFDTINTISNAAAKLLSIRNAGTELFYFSPAGTTPGLHLVSGAQLYAAQLNTDFIQSLTSGPPMGFASSVTDAPGNYGFLFATNTALADIAAWYSDGGVTPAMTLSRAGDLENTGYVSIGTDLYIGIGGGFVDTSPGLVGPNGFFFSSYLTSGNATPNCTIDAVVPRANTDKLFAVQNNAADKLLVYGNGDTTIKGSIKSALNFIGNEQFAVDSSGNIIVGGSLAAGEGNGDVSARRFLGPSNNNPIAIESFVTPSVGAVGIQLISPNLGAFASTYAVQMYGGGSPLWNVDPLGNTTQLAACGATQFQSNLSGGQFRAVGDAANSPNITSASIDSVTNFTAANVRLLRLKNASNEVAYIEAVSGRYNCTTTTTSGAGPLTANTASGRMSWTGTGTNTVTVNNSIVSANSLVFTQVESLGTGPTRVSTVVPAAGSFAVTFDANQTAGTTKFTFFVVNA